MGSDARRAVGIRGEQLALDHLARLGYRLVARNHRTRWGEIDLIVDNGSTLAFVEVKTRRAGGGSPFEKLGPAKRRQVRLMARAWLAQRVDRRRFAELRFDAIGVILDARGQLISLEHLEGAF